TDVLLVADTFEGLLRECHLLPEMRGELFEQLKSCRGLELIATNQGLKSGGGLGRRNPLAQPGSQVRMLSERIEFSGKDLIEIRFSDSRCTRHDGVCGEIA